MQFSIRPIAMAHFLMGCIGVVALAVGAHARESHRELVDVYPSPQLPPEDVVRTQLGVLSNSGTRAERIEKCYRFASPANREHTGPLERFARLFESSDYGVMLAARRFLVGKAIRQGREAYLLVTLIDEDGELSMFRFFLSQQTDGPYSDCWMTDSVVRLPLPTRPDSAPDNTDPAAI